MVSQRGIRGNFLAWVLLALLAAYCLFWAGGWVATYYAQIRIWALVPAFVVVGVWIVVAVRDPFWRPRSTLAPAFAVAFAVFAICTATSRLPRDSVEYLALTVLLVALYLLLQRLMASDFYRPRMITFATITGVLIGVAYLAVTVPHWIRWWGLIGHFAAPPLRPTFEGLTFGNPSAVLTASLLLAAPAIARLGGGGMVERIAAAIVAALTTTVMFVSGSRAGWLAVGIAVLCVGGLWVAAPERRSGLTGLARNRTARLLAGPVVVIAVLASAVIGPGLLERATSGGDGARPTYFATAVRMFEASPLVGTGPGTWVPQRILYTQAGEQDYYIPHAHNIYLQTLSEFGLLGLVAGLIVAVALARLLRGAIRDADPMRRRMGWAALFVTIYFAAHQLFDFYANAPAILFAFAIPITWLDATARPSTALPTPKLERWLTLAPNSRSMAVLIAGLVLVTASAGYLAWSERGASLLALGTDLMNDRKPAEALSPLTEAVRLDDQMPPYHFALGLALADSGDLVAAEVQLATAAETDGLPTAWLDVAAVRAKLGHREAASGALDQAMRLGNQQVAVALGAGVIQLQLGEAEAAIAAFATALELAPTLAGDPWWTADPARVAIWADVYRAAFVDSPVATRFVLALETGDSSGVADAIDATTDPETATTIRLVEHAWAGDVAAMGQLQARSRERPIDVAVVNWCSLLLRRAGREDEAADYTDWAATVAALSTPGGFEIRVSADPDTSTAGISSSYFGHYTYRRPVPNRQLVHWLPELEYR